MIYKINKFKCDFGGLAMAMMGWLLLLVAVGGAAWLQYSIHKQIQGPSNCMGCGKCDKTGFCILTGKPVGPRAKKP